LGLKTHSSSHDSKKRRNNWERSNYGTEKALIKRKKKRKLFENIGHCCKNPNPSSYFEIIRLYLITSNIIISKEINRNH